MKFLVTKHARDRLRERFRLKFSPSFFSDPRMTDSLIIGQVSTAIRKECWKRSPFHVNRVAWKYGQGTEIYHKSGIYFICNVQDNVCRVLTCTTRILYYK